MQLHADLASSLVRQVPQESYGGRIGRDGVVDKVGRLDGEAIEQLLHPSDAVDRTEVVRFARGRGRPVDVCLGVDDQAQLRSIQT